MTGEETDAEYKKCPVQLNALYELNDELDALLHGSSLRGDAVDSKTVVSWLRDLHNIVRDGLEKPRYPFPERE